MRHQESFWASTVLMLTEQRYIGSILERKMEALSKCLSEYGGGLLGLDLQLDLRHATDLTIGFEVIGRTLESLSFEVCTKEEHLNAPHFNISKIADLCPHIKQLFIDVSGTSDRLRDKIEGLYFSYWTKLRYIGISGREKIPFLQKIRSSCLNAVFDFQGLLEDPANALNILGPSVGQPAIRVGNRKKKFDHKFKLYNESTRETRICKLDPAVASRRTRGQRTSRSVDSSDQKKKAKAEFKIVLVSDLYKGLTAKAKYLPRNNP